MILSWCGEITTNHNTANCLAMQSWSSVRVFLSQLLTMVGFLAVTAEENPSEIWMNSYQLTVGFVLSPMFPNVSVSVGCHYCSIPVHWESRWVIWQNWQEFILLCHLPTQYKFGLSIPPAPMGLHWEVYGVWVSLLIVMPRFTAIMLTSSIPIIKTYTEPSFIVSCQISSDNMFWSRIKSDLKAGCQVYPFQPRVKVIGCIRKQGKYFAWIAQRNISFRGFFNSTNNCTIASLLIPKVSRERLSGKHMACHK